MPTSLNPQPSACPFLVIPELISPLTCEEIIGEVGFDLPTYDSVTAKATKTITMNKVASSFLDDVLEQGGIARIEQHFGVVVEDVASTLFEWYPPGYKTMPAVPETYRLANGSWVQSGDADLIGVLFLMDYHDGKSGPIDTEFEVLGGKLEFPNFKFGFNPTAGTMVVYPAAMNFANATTTTDVGELFQVRFYIQTTVPYKYQPQNFSGNHTTWFR